MSSQCKDCVHYCLCEPNSMAYGSKIYKSKAEEKCKHFKDKSRFVELPCEIGREVYWINNGKLYKSKFSLADMCGAYGKTVFLTREEAEKALKKRE